ncbi:MAG: sialate O-acetylesterase [Rikenellaceae bacterium]
MKRRLFSAMALFALALQPTQAKVTLNSIWGDGMVLQRNADVIFSGKSDGASVTITTTWSGKTKYKAAVTNGEWSVKIPTAEASVDHTITFNDGDKLTLTNVLLGDVWILMGQSNMQMPMSGFGFRGNNIAGSHLKNQHVEGSAQVITRAKASQPIRLYTIDYNPQNTPQESVGGRWECNTPEAVHSFSAVGYFFGQEIQQALDVPIGLLSVNRGSSSIETWMSREWLEGIDGIDFSALDKEELPQKVVSQPCYLYNGMVAPLKDISITGALWYQGESNHKKFEQYLELFPAFVAGLRDHFDSGEFPFYYAQLAPYIAPYIGNGADKYDVVLMREAMVKLMDLTPRTGMITLTDIGEERVIHPRYKREVGERFALWALCDTYGVENVHCRVPEYASMEVAVDNEVKQKGIALKFDHALTGIHFKERNKTSTQFEIAGEDRVFYPADVKFYAKNGASLWVWSEDVPEPVAVRYAFKNYAEGDVYNAFGLPLSSFRTDDWELPRF